ncbi:serine/threonine-protein kinase [Plasticicumulans acidivorans]|uniref:Serine/threonine-protein kinase PpkA n=1 Tax=Plasticicumulans acidivorans TaxID=886464 RepID=A0A317MVR3_9GAMM|nr:serine/threonine-protein kinase [Plasticicumulans acidivorans]PWV62401.1 serine/threonine-protein kinase PpkA [Plasticicumulans acidivorans]
MDILIPGYDIEGVLGSGAMASVYLALQRSLERRVALKVMASSLAADPQFCERFLREGKMLAKLAHPHVVQIYDIGNVDTLYYMAMEYISGGTLRDRIGAGMSPGQAITVLRQIAGALGYAHSRGLVHRDVKPANILFRDDDSAVLSDFGIAKNLQSENTQLTATNSAIGTPNYMSPEQAQGLTLDGRTDLYSLGVVLYEMLTGRLPYVNRDSDVAVALMHIRAPIPRLPEELIRYQPLLDRLLAKAPEDRFADAAQLLAFDIDAAAASRDNTNATVVLDTTVPADEAGTDTAATTISAPTNTTSDATVVAGAAAGADATVAAAATPPDDATRVATGSNISPDGTLVTPPRPNGRGPVLAGVAAAVLLAIGGGAWWWLQTPAPQPGPVVTTPPGGTSTTPVTPPSPSGQPAQDTGKPPLSPTRPVEPPRPSEPPPAVNNAPQPPSVPAVPANQTSPPQPARLDERPLLMPGKKTLFQRVVVGPDASLYADPAREVLQERLPAFAVYYVYERRSEGNRQWLRVGAASDGHADGWIDAARAYDWKQTLTLKFMPRSGRDPVMFFSQRGTLEGLFLKPDAPTIAHEWLTQVRAAHGKPVPGLSVVALEPSDTAVADDHFYLLPIFDYAETYAGAQQDQLVQLLQVASVDPGDAAPSGATAPAKEFRTGIVFVLDTTKSMDPYIDRARNVIRGLYQRIATENLLDKVGFGLVGFRSSTERTPGLEYVSRIYAPLRADARPDEILAEAQQMQATTVSSHSFDEDAFAGVMTAVERMDWTPWAGRIVVLVTDAGALRKNDPLGQTQMNEAEVRAAALAKGVHLFVLHLKTPAGRRDHDFAERQYRTLTANDNPRLGDLYVPVEGGDVDAYGRAVDTIASSFIDLVRSVAGNQELAQPNLDQPPSSIAARTAALGYALRMDWLGAQRSARPPSVVTAWVADRDLARPDVPAFQVCVLLTKLQLNDLQQALKLIVDAANRTQKSPQDFFREVASASAQLSRDPTRIAAATGAKNLVQTGLLGEFLEGLPYRSKVLNLSEELWLSWSVGEQQDFIQELESKIRLYETFHNDTANWVRFGNAAAGDALYRVPLSTLP